MLIRRVSFVIMGRCFGRLISVLIFCLIILVLFLCCFVCCCISILMSSGMMFLCFRLLVGVSVMWMVFFVF